MFRWNLMLQNRFGVRGQQSQTRRAKRTVKPQLEELTPRILPSASPLPVVSVASPPPVPSISAITSYVASMVEQEAQLIATIDRDLSSALNALGQQVSYVEQQWDRILGINPTVSTPVSNRTVSQSSNDNGKPQGHASGSGSGSDATPDQPIISGQGNTKPPPVTSGSGSGIATPETSSNATVTGRVWLDNNGDSSLDDNEMGYSGASVSHYYQVSGGDTWYPLGTTTTNSNQEGYNYSIDVPLSDAGNDLFEVQVGLSQYFTPTIPGPDSDIDAEGWSPTFTLGMGGEKVIDAGLRSMNVTTTEDDPDNEITQDQITLRDAIETGDNGPPFAAVTFSGAPGGTISLEDEALPAITASYNIDGPGASLLGVSGSGPQYPFRICDIGQGVTTEISGLTLSGGHDSTGSGGGVLDDGNLTLTSDKVQGNTTTGAGGGIYVGAGAKLQLQGTSVTGNSASKTGGGINNAGATVTIAGASQITNNLASNGGGGINNGVGGTINVSGGTQIDNNTDELSGGGVSNAGTFTMNGGSISNNYDQAGGGVANGGNMTLTGVAIQGNQASLVGGGIYVSAGKLTLKAGVAIGSSSGGGNAAENGAGIYVNGGIVKMTGGSIVSNDTKSGGSGGGIYVNEGSLTLNTVLIYGNTAYSGGNGGGLFIKGGTVTVGGGTFEDNTAGNSGGGIYNSSGSLTLRLGVTIGEENSASNQGGGAYLANASITTFTSCTVAGNQAKTGVGVYQQNNAQVKTAGLTDKDDPGGNPVKGP